MADPKFKVGDEVYSKNMDSVRKVIDILLDAEYTFYNLKVITNNRGKDLIGSLNFWSQKTAEKDFILYNSLENFVNAKLKEHGYA